MIVLTHCDCCGTLSECHFLGDWFLCDACFYELQRAVDKKDGTR